jgi:sugar lactone lactonase YvrE
MKKNLRQFRTALLAVIVLVLFGGTIVHADTIYAYCDGSGTIEKFNSSGQKSTFTSGVASYYLTCDSSGNLYATNWNGDDEIDKYDSSGHRSTFSSHLSSCLVFYSGYLYALTDNSTGIILEKFDSSGNSTTIASGLNNPWGLAFDGSSCFYNIDYDDESMKKIDLNGNISTFVSLGGYAGSLWSLACDSSGNLYASDVTGDQIMKFDSSGNMSIFASGLDTPMSLAFDSSGNLYVALMDNGIIEKIDPSGHMSVFASGLDTPMAIAIDVPEPASMAILALGGLTLLGRRRK